MDTTHFVKSIRDTAKMLAHSLLVALDLTSLYTNIPNLEGIGACTKDLSGHKTHTLKPCTSNLS